MDFNDATALMRLVQAVENDPYVSSGAGEALADKVREGFTGTRRPLHRVDI